MNITSLKARDIFLAAIKLPPADWDRYLDQTCEGDLDMRHRLVDLLNAHREAGSILNADAPAVARTIDMPAETPIAAVPGTVIGPYKLLQQIGEGGMGVVYMAEQSAPVRRKVALKIIKPGMDTREVIARFEAERQALAIMDHPNIAKVFDGGATTSGRPYFVMELVKGVPITDYGDQNHLTPKQRLELFVSVCHAVQHAHQKGIIHRDLKPSNVLVVVHDTTPVVKVIDFGVAKALGQELTEKTLFTGFAQMIGTPLYMSPEQAGESGLDIDTRSDIYSLGVLLYELLTGTTPLSKERFKKAEYDEIRRIIREDEPPKPSTRLSTTDELPSISANRGLEPKKLSDQVRGELDWIVMKALEKDRNRRYETANGFARDVQRYLSDEPVQACPPSTAYRFRKFARRNKASLVVAGLVLFFVVVLGAVIGWGVRDRSARELQVAHDRAERELEQAREQEARRAAAEQRVNLALEEAARSQEQGKWPEAHSAAKRAEGFLSTDASEALRQRVGEVCRDIEMVLRLDDARSQGLNGPVGGKGIDFDAMDAAYVKVFRDYGIDFAFEVEAVQVEPAAELIRARAIHQELVDSLDTWASSTRSNALRNKLIAIARAVDFDDWRNRVRDALWAGKQGQSLLAELAASDQVRALPPSTLCRLGTTLSNAGLKDEAVALLRDAQQRHPDDFWINVELASVLEVKQPAPWDEVVHFYSVALALRPQNAHASYRVGSALRQKGRPEEAIPYFQKAVDIDPNFISPHNDLGVALEAAGRPVDALSRYQTAVELAPNNALMLTNLGQSLQETGRTDEAIAVFRRAIAANARYARAYNRLGNVLRGKGDVNEAIANYRKANELDPDNIWNVLVLAELLQKVLELKPYDPQAHYDLGMAYAQLGRWKEAAAAYSRGLELDATASARLVLISVAHIDAVGGDVEGYRRACRELVKRFGDTDHAQVAEWTAKACLLLPDAPNTADFERVQKLAEQAVTGTEKHDYYHFYVRAKALADYRAGHYAETVEWLERYSANPDGVHWDAMAFAILSMACRRLDRTDEADAALTQAKTIMAKMPDPAQGRAFPGGQWEYWACPLVLVREAEDDLLLQTLALRKARLGADHPDTLHAMTDLANRYDKTGRYADAVKLYEELLALRKARLGTDHTDTLNTMADLAVRYSRLGRHADAVKLYEELLALRKARLGPDHADTLSAMASLADSYAALGREDEAIELYVETLKREKARPAADDNRLAATRMALAACYDKLGRHTDSLALYEEVLALRKARLGPDHPDTTWCLRLVAQTLVKLDRGAEAVPLIDEFVERLSGKIAWGYIAEMLWLRMRHFEKTRDGAGCRASAEMWEKQRQTIARSDAAFLYDAGCCRAITAAVIWAGDQSETAAGDAAAEADRAMSWLRKAAVAGINDLQRIKQDPDLDSLRGRDDFTSLVALRESEVAAREFEIGAAHAERGRWKEAAAAFGRGLELYPLDHERWCQGAALYARIGDAEAYRRACRELLMRFGDSDQRVVGERATKACLLLPDALSATDFEGVQKLAELAVTGGIENDGLAGFSAFAKGIANYRAGRHAEAVQWLERFAPSVNGGFVHNDATAFAVLAVAHHRLGHVNEAAAALAEAKSIIDQKMPDPPQGGWHVWTIALVLFREAEALLAKDAERKKPE